MATKLEFDSSPTQNNSDGEEEQDLVEEQVEEEEEEEDKKPAVDNVTDILKRLQSSGALIKKPKQEYKCFTCDEDYSNWEELENHLIQHVSLPLILLTKLQSDDEDFGDDWSDEDEVQDVPQASAQKTPQKIDISQILSKTGLSLKSPTKEITNSDSALNKLSGLGFTIKKNSTPVKQEKSEPDNQVQNKSVLQKLGSLGGIKLKLKSDGNNTNSFKVVNGLKDFKASDDEEDSEGDSKNPEGESDEEENKSGDISGCDQESEEEQNNTRKNSESDDYEKQLISNTSQPIKVNMLQKVNQRKSDLIKKTPSESTVLKESLTAKMRPAIKQTPKRGANLPLSARENQQEFVAESSPVVESLSTSLPERRVSETASSGNVVVKEEVDPGGGTQVQVPLFSGQIKTERSSPSPTVSTSTPVIATVKIEPDIAPSNTQPHFQFTNIESNAPLLPVMKTENSSSVTVIEINGDSNDEDDDCCVVSATPAPDVKPLIPKVENVAPPSSFPPPAYSTAPTSYSTPALSSRIPSTHSTEKQHCFNWNAPDSKPAIDMLEKSADDIFESLLSSTKKENISLTDASEYISLDTLGPQHSCDVCNTRFTNITLLEEHKRITGHSMSLVSPSSSTLLPYTPSSNILSSLLPVGKQMVEQIGKLGMGGSGTGFTHQQNVMINIQAYPGGGMVPPSPYNAYPPGQNMHGGYTQNSTNSMYNPSGSNVPGQYPGQSYMGPGYGQSFQQQMPKPGYPTSMPQSTHTVPPTSSPFSTTSPLQSMQQAVYGQSGLINQPQMGPSASMSQLYAPTSSSSGLMRPPSSTSSGIKIQNVQTFAPGQLGMAPGQINAPGAPSQAGAQMPAPGPIRMAAGANVTGARTRIPGVRGVRPSIRPGIQVHGQIRGTKPGQRMPLKRPGSMPGGPGQKRRSDMLLPGKHDNEDCQVMAMQKQRDGMPMIQSVQGAKDKLNLGSQISITKKTVNKEANAMANVLASRGISIKQKQKSRSPSPERPVPHIPNLGAGVSIKHTSKSSHFSIPEAKVGGGMLACRICKKMFMNQNSLSVHMTSAHPQSKIPMFKCDECPASYPKSMQLQHHKRVFHNVTGPNRELGLPVVDLSQDESLQRLSNLGIYSFIPLATRDQGNGCFGIPIVSVHNMQNGMTHSLQALGADGLLSLGPLKPLPNS